MISVKKLLYLIVAFCFISMITIVHVNEKAELKKILDGLWKRNYTFRNRWLALVDPNLIGSCHVPSLTYLDDFFNYGRNKAVMKCHYLAEIGGDFRMRNELYPYHEGARVVCLDKIKKGDCTVLSFGISYDPSFDLDVHRTANCSVYMFDPSVDGKIYNYIPKMKFFSLGLSGRKETITLLGNPAKIDRYETILKMLNLTDRVIDYLKVDIDGHEVSFLEDVLNTAPNLLRNVRQIGMEIHPAIHKPNVTFREQVKPIWKIMHRLECLGFSAIAFAPNLFQICMFEYNNRNVSGCYDIVYEQTIPFR